MKVSDRKVITIIANSDFTNWYMKLSQPEKDKVDNLMEENHLDYNRASDIELSRIKSLYEDSHKSSEDILQEVERWAAGRTKGFRKFDKYGIYLEKHSVEDLVKNYIKYFNQNVRDYGDGFAADWDSDDTMDILYKNGKIRTINPDFDEGTKRISVDGIDSIIVNGGWGTAFAGPSIIFEDYTAYDDIVDIRPTFDMSYWRR